MLARATKINKRWIPPQKVKTVIAFSALIILLACIFFIVQASRTYQATIVETKASSERLNNIMADQVHLNFLAVDITLRRIVERNYFNQLFGNRLNHDITSMLRLWVDETPQTAAILIVDKFGTALHAAFKRGYNNRIEYRRSFANHPLFTALQDPQNSGYMVMRQKDGDKDLLLLARANNALNGSFDGIVMAVIDPKIFTDFFASIDRNTTRYVSILPTKADDSEVLYAAQLSRKNSTEPVDTLGTIETVRSLLKDKELSSQSMTFEEIIGQKTHIFSAKKLGNLPLLMVVGIDENDFLKEWRDARLKDVTFIAIFTVAASLLTYLTFTQAKHIMRIEESEASAILASQAKSEFLANMSHELRTPLNAIIGFSEMITAGYFGELNAMQKERVQDINLCGSHLLQLISDILEFSKGEAGKLELQEEIFSLGESLDECSRIISEKAHSKFISIRLDIQPNLPNCRADKRKIRQIMLNLLSNSIKFTPEHGEITLAARQDRTGQLLLSVQDSGIGIPESEIQKALSVFGQVHRSQSHEGTGLGLPLCKMFAELHGGKLTLTSKVGIGTTVTISLPADRAVARQPA